jgi:hypothetical protein
VFPPPPPSGGHASTGQGGYYGSGGSRSLGRDKSSPHRPEAVAHAQDVAVLEGISGEVEVLEASLLAHGDAVSNATIELSAKLKKMVTQGSVMEVLDKLEFKVSKVAICCVCALRARPSGLTPSPSLLLPARARGSRCGA